MGIEKVLTSHPEGLTVFQEDIITGLFEIGAIKEGVRKKSGEITPVYVNLRMLQRFPQLLDATANEYLNLIGGLKFDVIAPIPMAAKDIGTTLLLKTGVGTITLRSGLKNHGTGDPIDGALPTDKGKVTLVVDDVISEGGSKEDFIKALRDNGYIVCDVVVFVDREEGGRERLKKLGCRLHTVMTLQQLIGYGARIGKCNPKP